jgi:NADPH:quinone reductase-like Zn-dependent oxidoreductase
MKAVLYERPGGPEVLQHVEVPDPAPLARDVVVRVEAAALNRLDVVQRSGWFALEGFTLPHIAGMDVAGTVASVGDQVTRVRVGDRVVVDPSLVGVPDGCTYVGMDQVPGALGVIGGTVAGGYAELCLAPETHVHPVPDTMSIEAAAAFPTAWLTAWHALFPVGRLAEGDTLMVHAAGSGLSVAAIQLAERAGATVLATARSADKCRRALDVGADHALVSEGADVAAWAHEVTGGPGVDMVFDHVGPALWAASLYSLRPGGRLVFCGNTTGDQATIPSLGHAYHNGLQILGSDAYQPGEFAAAWEHFCAHDYTAVIDSEFALADAAAAQDKLLRSDFFGKILLRP